MQILTSIFRCGDIRRNILRCLRDIISFFVYLVLCLIERQRRSILVYHSIAEENLSEDPYKLNVLLDNFEKHLNIISRDRDNIVITFDDGYKNNFTKAFPLLLKYGLTATIFLVTDFIDGKIGSESFAGKGFVAEALTWEDVTAMHKKGIQFGSHGKTHEILTRLSAEERKKELQHSKKRIEEVIGHSVDSFSYPYGNKSSFDNEVKDAILKTGFLYAYTNVMGSNDSKTLDHLILRRVRVYSDDGPMKLKMKIRGAYDWVDIFMD